MPARKMVWDNNDANIEVQSSPPDSGSVAPATPAVDARSPSNDVVTIQVDDGRNKISAGLPEWTLVPPSIPIKRLVRRR
jgi:hypothetical protein